VAPFPSDDSCRPILRVGGGFSKPWKWKVMFFQALEDFVGIFPSLGKNVGNFSKPWNVPGGQGGAGGAK
jgi:hypothetical protein